MGSGRMKKIESLTKEKESLISKYREEFLKIGLSTKPGNKEKAKEAIFECYKILGKEKPKYFLWFDSPMAAILAANFLQQDFKGGQLRDQLVGQLVGQLWGQLRGQLAGQLAGQLVDQLGNQLRGQLRGQFGGQLVDQLADQLWGQLRCQLADQLVNQLADQLGDR